MTSRSRTGGIRAAWERFENSKNKASDKQLPALPKQMPKPIFTTLENGQTQVKVAHKGENLVEITTQGTQALLTAQAKLLYQSLIDTEVE